MTRFSGKTAVVTGAAGGIGASVVARLIEDGATVIGLDNDTAGMDALTKQYTGHFLPQTCDLTRVAGIRDAMDAALASASGIPTVLVNAAGVYALNPALKVEIDDWDFNQHVNLRAAFFVTQALIAARKAALSNEPLAIINVSSTGAMRMGTGDAALSYSASKSGLQGLTIGMAAEWATDGVRVNMVIPGVINTKMLRIMDNPDAGQNWLDARVPMRRLGEPSEVANVVCFLASPEASYVTGASLVVDGGYLCV